MAERDRENETRIGLAATCARWFRDVGLQTDSGGLGDRVREDFERIVRCLGGCFDHVIAPGIVSTVEDASRAAAPFREAQIDALLIVNVMWSEDQPLLTFLDAFADTPLILWDYHPTGTLPEKLSTDDLFRYSGTVGLLQGSAPMQRRGLTLHIVSGSPSDRALAEELSEWNAALKIRRVFRGLNAGQLAGRCEVMTGTFVDEAALARLGVKLIAISAKEYAAACGAVDAARIEAFYSDLVRRFPVDGVSENSLRLACRNTLALDDLVLRHDLGALAIQDLDEELHRLAGIRPCLCPPASAERGVAFGMEGDLNTTLGMLAAMGASGSPAMFTEVFTYDPRKGILLMGHAGVHDPGLAASDGVTLVPDAEYRHADACEGAWQEFILAEGPVTCVSLYDTGRGYCMTVFEGESLGAPRRIAGFAHAAVRPDVPVTELVPRLVRRGMTQHFAVARGRIATVLQIWCAVNGIECCIER